MIYRAEKFSADDVMEETERKINQAHALVNAIACSPNAVSEDEVCGVLNFLDVVSEQFRECMKAVELIQGTEAQGDREQPVRIPVETRTGNDTEKQKGTTCINSVGAGRKMP